MKVFAEYFHENGKEYRKTTLLQIGDSTNLIGSAVLMNPGSAKPSESEPNHEVVKAFFKENHPQKAVNLKNWRNFSPDSTMNQLEKIFNGWYVGKQTKLNGIIQLFNCFYYRDPKLEVALKNFESGSKDNFNEYDLLLDKPVYFGWGGAGKGKLKPVASAIFSKYDLTKTPIYDPKFENNNFYHPGYINRVYNRLSPQSKDVLEKFTNLITNKK